MPVERNIPYKEGVYFITFTCYKWLPLIQQTGCYDLLYTWFDHLVLLGHYIVGYQTMPNHLHLLIAFSNQGDGLNKVIGNGKRFLAYKMIERLKKANQLHTLRKLQLGVNSSDLKRGKRHEVWEKSFDWKECNSVKMILQKLNYMHENVCAGKWQLAENPVDYLHSSAKFYLTGEQGIYKVTSYTELEDIDLTKKSSR